MFYRIYQKNSVWKLLPFNRSQIKTKLIWVNALTIITASNEIEQIIESQNVQNTNAHYMCAVGIFFVILFPEIMGCERDGQHLQNNLFLKDRENLGSHLNCLHCGYRKRKCNELQTTKLQHNGWLWQQTTFWIVTVIFLKN